MSDSDTLTLDQIVKMVTSKRDQHCHDDDNMMRAFTGTEYADSAIIEIKKRITALREAAD